jgi:hypothetical protein
MPGISKSTHDRSLPAFENSSNAAPKLNSTKEIVFRIKTAYPTCQ